MVAAPPGGTLANTLPSTSRAPAPSTNHRAMASNRGREAGDGRAPMTLESVMSMLGASHTSRSSSAGSEAGVAASGASVMAAMVALDLLTRSRLRSRRYMGVDV